MATYAEDTALLSKHIDSVIASVKILAFVITKTERLKCKPIETSAC